MPVYMNSGKIVADGRTGRVDGDSKVLQEVLADLKSLKKLCRTSCWNVPGHVVRKSSGPPLGMS